MSSELAVIESVEELEAAPDLSGMSLAGLAEIANREHGLALAAGMSMLDHAIIAGEALLAAKVSVPWGEWEAWVAREFSGSVSSATNYMRYATYKAVLGELGVTSQVVAKQKLKELALVRSADHFGMPKSLRREACALVKAGRQQKEVAELYGVSQSTLWAWINPQAKRERNIGYRRRRKLALAALRKQEQADAARKVGGNIGEAYSMARKLAEEIDRAIACEGNPEARKALTSAYGSLRRVEDEINKAIGTHTTLETK